MDEVAKRIKKMRLEKKLTQYELAIKLGLNGESAIVNYEKGRSIPKDDIKYKMCDFFGCSMDYLMGKDEFQKALIKHDKISKSISINVYGTIPAGIPLEMIEDIIDTEEIPASWLKGGKQFFGLKVKGTSMSPTYLDGDTIILEKVDNCESGQDAVVMVNGYDGTFKRVFKNENGIILQPLNSAFEPMIYTNQQILDLPVKIIGVAKEIRRKI